MELKRIIATVALLIIGFVYCQDDLDLPDLSGIKNQIPGLENISENDLPKKEDVDKFLKKKCEDNGGDFDALERAKDNVKTCIEQHINFTVVMEEVEEAKKTGSMDEVFGKYCKKKSLFMTCVNDITNEVRKCLQSNEQEHMEIVMNTTDSLVDFICFKDGDRLAMFVAEGGFECLEERKDGIQGCINKTLSGKIPSDLSLANLPVLLIGEDECRDLDKLQICIIEELEHCADNTPANLAEALFKFIRKVPVCKDVTPNVVASAKTDRRIYKRAPGDEDKEVDSGLLSILNNKCYKNAGYIPKHITDLELKYEICYNVSIYDKDPVTIGPCTYLEPQTWQCLSNLIDDLKPCFSKEEAYVNEFAKAAIKSSLNFICDDKMMNYHKFFSTPGSHCVLLREKTILEKCVYSNTFKTYSNGEVIWTKSNLCGKIRDVDTCVEKFISEECPNDQILNQLAKGLFGSLTQSCNVQEVTAAKTSSANSLGISNCYFRLYSIVILISLRFL